MTDVYLESYELDLIVKEEREERNNLALDMYELKALQMVKKDKFKKELYQMVKDFFDGEDLELDNEAIEKILKSIYDD